MSFFLMIVIFSAGVSVLVSRLTAHRFSLVFLLMILMTSSLTIKKLHKLQEKEAASDLALQ